MLFLIRSAFWLGIVYSAMPFDNDQQARELARLRSTLAATAGGAAVLACAERNISCRALTLAMPQGTAPELEIPGGAKDKAARKSANSLTPTDAKPLWRGKPARSANNQPLAKRREMPI